MIYSDKKLQAVLFDLDGVICDTAKYHYQAWKKMVNEENIYFDEKINERLKGVSRMESLNIIMERRNREYSQEELELLAKKKNNCYVNLLEQLTPEDILPSVYEFILQLKESGIKIAICSSSRNTDTIVEKLGIRHLFDTIVTGNDITKTKPNPQVFMIACQQLGVLAENCVVIEDAAAGIEAAIAGGMKSIGIGEKSRLYKADCIINTTKELSMRIINEIFV